LSNLCQRGGNIASGDAKLTFKVFYQVCLGSINLENTNTDEERNTFMVQILGQFNDTLTLGSDTIPGVDTVFGLDGSDILTTSTLGGSVLYGNRDNDSLTSQAAGNILYGGQENDRLLSLAGGSLFFGDLGDDLFEAFGGTGKDTVYGGTSDGALNDGGDVFNFGNAGGGGNLGYGNAGDDFLSGSGLGSDTLWGGKGDDTIQVVELSGSGTAGGGTGGFVPQNTVISNIGIRTGNISGGTVASTTGAVGVVTTTGANPPNNPGRNYLSGDLGKDLVIGLGDRDTLLGGEENDTLMLLGDIANPPNENTSLQGATVNLNGVPQNALLDGGNGNDSLIAFGGLRGRNTLLGGEGVDTIYNYGVQSHVEGGAGNDILVMDNAFGVFGRSTLMGGAGDDSIRTETSGGTNLLYGDVGNDTLVGTAAPTGFGDTLYGGDAANADTGNDSLTAGTRSLMFGQQGNDTLVGTGGNASLYGGQGTDSLLATANSYLSGDLGNDTLNVTGSGNTLLGGEGNDSLFGLNGTGNILNGGVGNDILVAGSDTDTLIGGEGNDFFIGSAGADTLGGEAGRSGSDTLYGGAGADSLVGTAGFDGFYYASNGEIGDTITSFQSGTDKIYLRSTAFGNVDANGNPVANLAAPGQSLRTGLDFFSVPANQDYTGTFSGGSTTLPAIVFDSNAGGGGILYWDITGGGNVNTGGANLSVIATIGTGSVSFNDIVIF
jgi:Ca2+-binding RTX toxin-like protein